MASAGSIELELKLNRSGFDRELAELQSLKLEPLKLGIELDGKNIRSQIRGLTKDLDCIPLDICAHINVSALKADIAKTTKDLQADLQVNVRAAIESIVKVDAKKQGEAAGTDKAREKLEAGFEKVADTLAAKINSAIDSSLKAVVSTAAAPFQGVARGFFEGIGQTASRELSNGLIKNFQKSLDLSFKSVGGDLGDFAAKEIGKALGLKPMPKSTTNPPVTQPVVGEANLKPGRGFLKGDVASLKPEDARKQVEVVRSRLEKQLAALQSAPETEATQKKIVSLVNAIATLESRIAADIANPDVPRAVKSSLGQLKGASSKLAETKRTAEAEAARVTANRKLPGIAKGVLGAGIGASALGAGSAFAAPGAGAGVGGLGFLGALPFDPTLGLAAGGIAASLFAARQVPGLLRKSGADRAANVLETDVVKFVGDTVKQVFGQVQEGLNRAFRKNKTAAVVPLLNSPPLAAAETPATKAFAQNIRRLALSPPVPQEKPQPEDTPALQAFAQNMRRLAASRGRLPTKPATLPPLPPFPPPQVPGSQNTGRLTLPTFSPPAKTVIAPLSITPKPSPLAPPPPVPNNYWERFFRGLETRFFRSPLFSGNVSPKDRRSLTSEAAGFFASGAALVAPGATLTALSVPLLAALTPLITTVGLVTSAIAPLVGTIAQTLRQVEPLQKRLEFTAGGKPQAAKDNQFIQGLASTYNIGEIGSLEQFTKLQAAARGTRLEGQGLRDVFEGIVLGTKALGLSTQDLNLVFYGFQNIISKSRISSEEIRQQLSEKFAPTIGVFSKALGVTQQEFTRLLESGSLLAEDVLPKVGRQLKLEFGQVALEGAKTFDSALTRIDNALNRIKIGFATTLAPVLTSVTNSVSKVLEFFGNNAQKIVGIASVVLAGFAAQFFVGLTQILESSGIVAKMTTFLVPLFSRLFVTLTPFAVGILADFLDDVVGTQTSVIENLMKGTYNAVLGAVLVFNDLGQAISSAFAKLPKTDFSGISDGLASIGNVLKPLDGLLRNTVVEFVSLTLILAQTLVLVQGGLNLVLARFGVTIASLGTSFVAAARSGKLFQSVMTTLSAGLTKAQLATTAATAAFLLFFAKADFTNELGSEFDKLSVQMTSALDEITKATTKTGNALAALPEQINRLKSQGFDLTLGIGDATGLGAFKTDDLINTANDFKKKINKFYLDRGLISQKEYDQETGEDLVTVAEKQFADNILKLDAQASEYQKIVEKSGLLSSNFGATLGGTSLAGIRAIDQEIRSLQNRRVELLGEDNVNTDAVKKEIFEIDKQIQSLLKNREKTKSPIEQIRKNLLQGADVLQKDLEKINNSTDLPENRKEEARKILQPSIALSGAVGKKLAELGAIDLSPLGNQFTDVTKEIEKTDRALEKTLSRGQLETTKRSGQIQADLVAGKITPEVAARKQADNELEGLKRRSRDLATFVKGRRSELKDLLALPEPNSDQLQIIDRNQKEIESKEFELAQTRLTIGQKVIDGRKQIEERILKDFQKANAKAAEVIGRAETQRLTQIKQRQLQGLITPEQAETESVSSSAITAKANFTEATRQLSEFNKLKKTGRISDEEARARELELNRAVSDANLRRVEAEISQQQQLRNTEIRAIEERTQKQKNLSDLAISGIEQQKAAQDLLNSSIDRAKELETSRFELTKVLSDSAVSAAEREVENANRALELSRKLNDENLDSGLRSQIQNQLSAAGFGATELEILQRRGQIEEDLAQKRLAALQTEQAFQRQSLELDLKRQEIAARTQQFEAQITLLRSQQSRIEAESALNVARQSGDLGKIAAAEIGVELASKQLLLSEQQLQNSKENLKIQRELTDNALRTQQISQQSALDSAKATEDARRQSQLLEQAEAAVPKSTSTPRNSVIESPSIERSAVDSVNPKSQGKQLSLFEQSRLKIFAPMDTFVRKYLAPDQSGSKGLNRATSVESQLKRAIGIDPFQSVEQYLSRPRSISFGADSASSFEQLNLKYKPGAANFEELQQKFKPLTESIDSLNKQYAPIDMTPGLAKIDGMNEANRGIRDVVSRLDQLIQANTAALASPRTLNVSSANPVQDGAYLFGEIARQSLLNNGLG